MNGFRRFFSVRQLINSKINADSKNCVYPELDLDYICDKSKFTEIEENICRRKNVGNIKRVHELLAEFETSVGTEQSLNEFFKEAKLLPNHTHPEVLHYTEPKIIGFVGKKPIFKQKPLDFDIIAKATSLYRKEHIGNVCGHRSYYILGQLANLEHALIKYTINFLLEKHFRLLSVPDILPAHVLECCGMNLNTDRNQIYYVNLNDNLNKEQYCLSGTSEMAIAYYYANKCLKSEDLPIRCAAISRCYRAEANSALEERGIYRVHHFNKVEMFALCAPSNSQQIFNEFLEIQKELYTNLGLHFRILDMPANELGAAAFRKFDIEAWMPGREMYGEISSCSNCTDYQSRRLSIKFGNDDGFVHTVNGTACAVPRLLIALVETNQDSDKTVKIPERLKKFLLNPEPIGRQKKIPNLKLIKSIV